MFSIYLPDSIYEQLPKIYLLLALGLVFTPLASVKWVAITALAIALVLTKHQRQVYREGQKARNITLMREKYGR